MHLHCNLLPPLGIIKLERNFWKQVGLLSSKAVIKQLNMAVLQNNGQIHSRETSKAFVVINTPQASPLTFLLTNWPPSAVVHITRLFLLRDHPRCNSFPSPPSNGFRLVFKSHNSIEKKARPFKMVERLPFHKGCALLKVLYRNL